MGKKVTLSVGKKGGAFSTDKKRNETTPDGLVAFGGGAGSLRRGKDPEKQTCCE